MTYNPRDDFAKSIQACYEELRKRPKETWPKFLQKRKIMQNDAREQERQKARKTAFEKWLEEPMVRLGMSMIPAGEKDDALKMLLQSAFDSGFNTGGGVMALEMLHMAMKPRAADGL